MYGWLDLSKALWSIGALPIDHSRLSFQAFALMILTEPRVYLVVSVFRNSFLASSMAMTRYDSQLTKVQRTYLAHTSTCFWHDMGYTSWC